MGKPNESSERQNPISLKEAAHMPGLDFSKMVCVRNGVRVYGPGMTPEQRARAICKADGVDYDEMEKRLAERRARVTARAEALLKDSNRPSAKS